MHSVTSHVEHLHDYELAYAFFRKTVQCFPSQTILCIVYKVLLWQYKVEDCGLLVCHLLVEFLLVRPTNT